MNKKRLFFWLMSIILVCLALGMPLDVLAEEASGGSTKKAAFAVAIQNLIKTYGSEACWFCTVFESVYDAINTMTGTLFNNLGKSFLSLMGIGILFLLLFKVGKMLVQLQDVDLMQFLNDLFKPLGRAIIATALLGVTVAANNQTIFYLLTNPFIEISLRISEEIVSTSLEKVEVLKSDSSGSSVEKGTVGTVDWSDVNNEFSQENSSAPDTAMGKATKKLMVAWMKKVSSSFVVGMATGATLCILGVRNNNIFLKGLPLMVAGAIMFCGFGLIYLMFPVRLMNAFVRIAFVFALMPLWIILWVFPPTQQYTKKAWEMFLSACLMFIILSVMVSLALMLLNNIVPEKLVNSETGDTKTRSEFFDLLIQGKDEEAKKYASISGVLVLNTIAFTALAWVLLEKAEVLANSFIGGGGNVQLNIANQTVATAAKGAGVVWAGAKATTKVGVWAGKKAGSKVLSAAKKRFGGSSQNSGSGGGSGNGSGGGGGGGTTPPPRGNPTIVPGPRGERGEQGRQGERGERGPRGEDAIRPNNPPMPEGTDVRESITPPEAPQPIVAPMPEVRSRAATRENELYDAQNNPEARERLMASAGANERTALQNMEQAMRSGQDLSSHRQALQEAIMSDIRQSQASGAGNPLAALSPERARAVQGLAGEGGKAQQLQNLSQDVAFIENSLGMKRGDFEAAMKGHTWLTDAKEMKSFADSAYSYKNSPALMEAATKRMLKGTYLSSTDTMDETTQMAKRTAQGITHQSSNVLSRDLNSLAAQVSDAEAVKKLTRS